MANEAKEYVNQSQPIQQQRYSGIDKAKCIKGYGSYQYCIPAQDQIIAYIEGMKISGTFTPSPEDSQSDYADGPPTQINKVALYATLKQSFEELSNRAWLEAWKSVADEEPSQSVTVKDQVDGRTDDTTTNDISQWPSGQLASAIMQPAAESDMPCLREMILTAEDTGFTVEQSEQLAPRLLSFAAKYRNSSDPQNEAAVWSAIRTGASMLRPQDADLLLPLLEPGHSIETSLVTVKMLGRIFEAQPPTEVDEHQKLANEVCQIAESLVNPHAITASQTAAKAQLAIYALAAMASSRTEPIVEAVQELGVTWFTRRTFRKLCDLSNTWTRRQTAVPKAPRQLLDKVLQMLKPD